jgi:hypothetical protein
MVETKPVPHHQDGESWCLITRRLPPACCYQLRYISWKVLFRRTNYGPVTVCYSSWLEQRLEAHEILELNIPSLQQSLCCCGSWYEDLYTVVPH